MLRYWSAQRGNTDTIALVGIRTLQPQSVELACAAGRSAHEGAQGGRRPASDRV